MGRWRRLEGLNERLQELFTTELANKKAVEIEANLLGKTFRTGDKGLSYIDKWLNHYAEPSAYYLAAICRYFNVSANWLLGLSDKRELE